MSFLHNAAQYDSWLPAWALPPPLMCLHFHPMAVSRWFSAASLKQVSNMAITGSGSLAISLSLCVISAAFLLKGKFCRCPCARACVCVMRNYVLGSRRSTGEKLWRVCALDAHKLFHPDISASLSTAPIRPSAVCRHCLRELIKDDWKGVVPSFTARATSDCWEKSC